MNNLEERKLSLNIFILIHIKSKPTVFIIIQVLNVLLKMSYIIITIVNKFIYF